MVGNMSSRYTPSPSYVAFYEVPCEPGEHINAMHAVVLSKATYLCVGTVVVDPFDLEPTKGRLIVFKIHTDGRPSLHLVSSTPVRGCVYAIVSKRDTLALAVNSAVGPTIPKAWSVLQKLDFQVKMFRLVEVEGEKPLHVELLTEWDHSYVLQCMATSVDTLIIGDIVRSVALLDVDWKKGKLERKARDNQDLGPYRLAVSGDKGIIGANVS